MAIYQYIKPDGDIVERSAPMSQAPPLGHKIKVDGVTAVRVLSNTVAQNGTAYDFNSYPKICSTLPVFSEGAEHVNQPGHADHGKPIILSRHHQDELCRRHGYTRDYTHTDLDYSEKKDGNRGLDYVPWDR